MSEQEGHRSDRALHVVVLDVAEDAAQQQDVDRDGTREDGRGARVALHHLEPGWRGTPRNISEVGAYLDKAASDVTTPRMPGQHGQDVAAPPGAQAK